MADDIIAQACTYTRHFAAASALPAALFDYAARSFLPQTPGFFCAECCYTRENRCDHTTAHRYGCYEAERWGGVYVYHCPRGLAFVATCVYQGRQPCCAIVAGPIQMGPPDDLPPEPALPIPRRTAGEVSALSHIQQALCRYLSGENASQAESLRKAQSHLNNSLYAQAAQMRNGQRAAYPLELEQRLRRMITRGDRSEAQALINQLLGTLYFHSGGDFDEIKRRAEELIVLFSRAATDGGADVQQIFLSHRDYLAELKALEALDDLSIFLTNIFTRFVGYVFDFARFKHADTLVKAVRYIEAHYTQKVALEDVAAHVGFSPSYLSALLKQEMGMPFSQYINHIRVEKAKELLLNPANSLSAISAALGFSDQSYFTKVFTRATGISPGQYKAHRGLPPARPGVAANGGLRGGRSPAQ